MRVLFVFASLAALATLCSQPILASPLRRTVSDEGPFCNSFPSYGLDLSNPEHQLIRNHYFHSLLIGQNPPLTSNSSARETNFLNILKCQWALPYFKQGKIVSISNHFGPVIVEEGNQDRDVAFQYLSAIQSMNTTTGELASSIVVSFRGTNLNETGRSTTLQADADVHMVNFYTGNTCNGTQYPNQVCLLNGYYNLFGKVLRSSYGNRNFSQYIDTLIQGNTPVSITGHSLGGGLSQVLAFYMLDRMAALNITNPILGRITTFASPSVFNQYGFNRFLNQTTGRVTSDFKINRIVNPRDPIPNLYAYDTVAEPLALFNDWMQGSNGTGRVDSNISSNKTAIIYKAFFGIYFLVASNVSTFNVTTAHFCADSTGFQDFNYPIYLAADPTETGNFLTSFDAEVSLQHNDAYAMLTSVNVPALNMDVCAVDPIFRYQHLSNVLEEMREAMTEY